jgi:hypothetical protein
MTVVPQLERSLTAAAARRIAPAPSLGTRLRARLGTRTFGVAFASLAVTGTAVAAVAGWNPLIGDHTGGAPTQSSSAVPAADSAVLGVLRHAPTAQDHGAAVERTLRGLYADNVRGLRVGSIRYLAAAPGAGATVLYSVRRSEEVGHDGRVDAWTVKDPLCFARPYAAGGDAPAACFRLAQVAAGRAIVVEGGPSSSLTSGLAPDGVARVSATQPDGSTTTVAVQNNYYEIASNSASPVEDITLYRVDGSVFLRDAGF